MIGGREFIISVKKGDLLRLVKENYERQYYKVTESSFGNTITIVMIKKPKDIEEVKLAYQFKGDLAKNIKYLN